MKMRCGNSANIPSIIEKLARCEECSWINPKKLPFDAVDGLAWATGGSMIPNDEKMRTF